MFLVLPAILAVAIHAAATAIGGWRGLAWTVGVEAVVFGVWLLLILARLGTEPAFVGAASLLGAFNSPRLELVLGLFGALVWSALGLTGAIIGAAVRQLGVAIRSRRGTASS